MTTKVIIGSNEIRDYSFLAPMTGLVWREVIGYEPYFFIAGDWQEKRRNQLARQALANFDFFVLSLGAVPSRTRGTYQTSTAAQNVRQHAAMLPSFEVDDWLMPSDADLWPIRKSFYYQHEGSPAKAVCYYANGDHYSTLPTCHVTMQVKTWREVYGYDISAVGLEDQIGRTIDEWLPKRKYWHEDEGFAVWMSDQAIATDKLREMPWFASGATMIERRGHPPVDRLDRGSWPIPGYRLENYVDAHLPRPCDQPGNWEKTLELFAQLCPQHVEWAKKYREAYLLGY